MTNDEQESRIHKAGAKAMVEEAARIRAELCESRGLPPSSGCAVPAMRAKPQDASKKPA